MAQRRLFSPDIICSDDFLDMPTSSRDLYVQLAIRADDDGFISPKGVMKLVGAADDDLKVLLAKRFVLEFSGGVVVIKHWLIHNSIRKDRYKTTRYLEEKSSLRVKENGAYTEYSEDGVRLLANWQPNGNQMAAQVKLSKDKLLGASASSFLPEGARIEDDTAKRNKKDTGYSSIFDVFSKRKQGWMIHKTQIEAAQILLSERGVVQVKSAMDFYRDHKGEKYLPDIFTPFDLEAKWSKLFAFKERV